MNSKEIKALAEKVFMKTYGRYDLAITRGDGVHLYDPEGNEYLDFVAGLAVASLGHANEDVARTVAEQARTLVHVSNLYYTEPQVKLAQKLVENCFADRVFFGNSGAEANEAAIKLARKYSFDKYGPNRFKILTIDNSFHGRTMVTLSATAQADKHVGFEPLNEGFSYLPLNDLGAARKAFNAGGVCAIMIEPIQGEGGVNEVDQDYLTAVRELCTENDILLIFDEIQVGMGRLGTLFAHQLFGVEPDIMTLAKALANGLPIGAALAREEVAEAFGPGTHASTFGGTPLVTSAALTVLETMLAPGFLDHVQKVGDYFKSRLLELKQKYDYVEEVRGRGLLLGLKVSFPAADMVPRMTARGYLINCIQGSVLRFLPPLIISESEIDSLMPVLEETLASMADSHGG
ncbi:MAG: aspartate aminotransferase family protein [Deltaproteobacteria bacterium]|nr:aspartate aminotransferase family protein [Deltaproteobacteria bacterium]